jgi:hypothetical protein
MFKPVSLSSPGELLEKQVGLDRDQLDRVHGLFRLVQGDNKRQEQLLTKMTVRDSAVLRAVA